MVYFVKKYEHYLLGYKFTFHVDHDALQYMINKPQLVEELLGGFCFFKNLTLLLI